MPELYTQECDLSGRLRRLAREFRLVKDGHHDFTGTSSATFAAELDEAAEDAALLEAEIGSQRRPRRAPEVLKHGGNVIAFQRPPELYVVRDEDEGPEGGAA